VLEERWKLDQLHLFRSRLRASGPRKQPAQEIVRVCGESDAGCVLASSAPYDVPIFEESAHTLVSRLVLLQSALVQQTLPE
jgi:hypothetical protein